MKIGFQGIKGAFSHQSANEYYGGKEEAIGYETFKDVFDALEHDEVEEIIVPIENASTGSILDIYDLLKKYHFYIVGEQIIYINQCLLGIKGSQLKDIQYVYSHLQGIQQSSQFLEQYPHIQCIPYKNTAISAEKVYSDGKTNQAAIASSFAAKIYHLDILVENIQNMKNNQTRFIVLSKHRNHSGSKISVSFNLDNRLGQLSRILDLFSYFKCDMTRIESRPILSKPWEYTFFIDALISENTYLDEFIKKLEKETQHLRFLGIYDSRKEKEEK